MEASLQKIETFDIGVAGDRVIDLTNVPPGIVGIVGDLGSGKTMLMEASLPGGLWMRMPSRVPSAIAQSAVSKRGVIRATWMLDDVEHVFEHHVDGAKHKKATIRAGGEHVAAAGVVADGKVGTFKIVRDRLFGGDSWEAVSASVFWVQGGDGAFTRLMPTDARNVLSQLLGAKRHADVHAIVSKWFLTARRDAEALESKVTALRAAADREESRRSDESEARRELADAARRLGRSRSQLSKTVDVEVKAGSVSPEELERMRERERTFVSEIESFKARLLDEDEERRLRTSWAARADLSKLSARRIVVPTHHVEDAEFDLATRQQLASGLEAQLSSCRSQSVRESVPCRGVDQFSTCRFLPSPPTVPVSAADEAGIEDRLKSAVASVRTARRELDDQLARARAAETYSAQLAEQQAEERRLSSLLVDGDVDRLRRHDEATPILRRVSTELQEIRWRLERVSVADLDAAERRRVAEEAVRSGEMEVNRLRGRVESLVRHANETAVDELEAALVEASAARRRSDDLEVVRGAFHVSGIPEALIRSAGPEVARRATEMLEEVVGDPRFVVDLDDGVNVTDSSRAVWSGGALRRPVGNLSGGQKALVESAVRLAISEVSGAHGVTRWRTVFADEMASGLGVAGPSWVQLLRSSARRQGLRHMLVVSHDPRVIACLDTVFEIGPGGPQ